MGRFGRDNVRFNGIWNITTWGVHLGATVGRPIITVPLLCLGRLVRLGTAQGRTPPSASLHMSKVLGAADPQLLEGVLRSRTQAPL